MRWSMAIVCGWMVASIAIAAPADDVLALDRALEKLEVEDPRKAEIVKLRYFAGLDREETAAALDVSLRTIDREWRFVVAWLHKEISERSTDRDIIR